MVHQVRLSLLPRPKGFHLITEDILTALGPLPEKGLLHVFILHTSAGLAISENADPTVRSDLNKAFDHLAPENQKYYEHTTEGPDDMPAHVKSIITGSSITVPIENNRPCLGTWQGIYLCEFRNNGGGRKIVVTLLG